MPVNKGSLLRSPLVCLRKQVQQWLLLPINKHIFVLNDLGDNIDLKLKTIFSHFGFISFPYSQDPKVKLSLILQEDLTISLIRVVREKIFGLLHSLLPGDLIKSRT